MDTLQQLFKCCHEGLEVQVNLLGNFCRFMFYLYLEEVEAEEVRGVVRELGGNGEAQEREVSVRAAAGTGRGEEGRGRKRKWRPRRAAVRRGGRIPRVDVSRISYCSFQHCKHSRPQLLSLVTAFAQPHPWRALTERRCNKSSVENTRILVGRGAMSRRNKLSVSTGGLPNYLCPQ